MRRALVLYSLGRVGVFLLAALLIWSGSNLVGHPLNGLPLALVAAFVSAGIGYVVFAPQRALLAEAVQARRDAKVVDIAARRARLDEER